MGERIGTGQDAIKHLRVPPNVARVRYRPPAEVAIPADAPVPFVGGPNDPPERQVQEVWHARVRVFKLPDEQEDYEKVWQRITDGHAKYSAHIEQFDPNTGTFVALLRWTDLEPKMPERPIPAS